MAEPLNLVFLEPGPVVYDYLRDGVGQKTWLNEHGKLAGSLEDVFRDIIENCGFMINPTMEALIADCVVECDGIMKQVPVSKWKLWKRLQSRTPAMLDSMRKGQDEIVLAAHELLPLFAAFRLLGRTTSNRQGTEVTEFLYQSQQFIRIPTSIVFWQGVRRPFTIKSIPPHFRTISDATFKRIAKAMQWGVAKHDLEEPGGGFIKSADYPTILGPLGQASEEGSPSSDEAKKDSRAAEEATARQETAMEKAEKEETRKVREANGIQIKKRKIDECTDPTERAAKLAKYFEVKNKEDQEPDLGWEDRLKRLVVLPTADDTQTKISKGYRIVEYQETMTREHLRTLFAEVMEAFDRDEIIPNMADKTLDLVEEPCVIVMPPDLRFWLMQCAMKRSGYDKIVTWCKRYKDVEKDAVQYTAVRVKRVEPKILDENPGIAEVLAKLGKIEQRNSGFNEAITSLAKEVAELGKKFDKLIELQQKNGEDSGS